MKLNLRIIVRHGALWVSHEPMSLRLFLHMWILFLAIIPLSTHADDVQFRITVAPDALVGYDGFQLIGYAADPNSNHYVPFPSPIPLPPGQTTVTPIIPVALNMVGNRFGTTVDAQLIFRLTRSLWRMQPGTADIWTRITIMERYRRSGPTTVEIYEIADRPEHQGDLRPSFRFVPSPPVNFVPNVPPILDIEIVGVLAPITNWASPCIGLL